MGTLTVALSASYAGGGANGRCTSPTAKLCCQLTLSVRSIQRLARARSTRASAPSAARRFDARSGRLALACAISASTSKVRGLMRRSPAGAIAAAPPRASRGRARARGRPPRRRPRRVSTSPRKRCASTRDCVSATLPTSPARRRSSLTSTSRSRLLERLLLALEHQPRVERRR